MPSSVSKARRFLLGSVLLAGAVFPAAVVGAEDLLERGAQVFRQCAECHMIGDGAVHLSGPHLNQVVGRPIGTVEGYHFSEPLARAGDQGEVWDAASLDRFLRTPQGSRPGTWMYFDGLPDEGSRTAVIAYLEAMGRSETLSSGGLDPEVEEILALQADPAYGAYLSSECTSCHRVGGEDIPAINGLPRAVFAAGLLAYRNGTRDHQVMTMLAGRLGNSEIAALAVYFESVE